MTKRLRAGISLLLVIVMIVSNAAFVRAETADESVDITMGLLAHYDFEIVEGTTVSNNVTTNETTTSSAVTRTQWQHITFSYDMDNSKTYFFVNGVADRAEGLSLSSTALNTNHMIIGRHRNDGEGPLNGLVDEVRVYNRVLTAEEAAAVYAYAPSETPPPPNLTYLPQKASP